MNRRPFKVAIRTLAAICTLALAACSKQQAEPPPVVSVQAAPVKQGSISQVVTADAVLYPINQATIVPKIASPVLKAYVTRGQKVRQGQLLVTLENKDLAAAAEEKQGDLEQSRAAFTIATQNTVPEEVQKAQDDARTAKENLDAQQKIYDSRKVLLDQGAIARKDFDSATVALVQAKAQYEQAQKHLAGLQSIGHQQELRSVAGQLKAAEGVSKNADAQLGYSEIRSPIDGVVTDGPWYPGMMPQAGAPLVTVMNLSQMVAKAHIPQNQAALLKKGDEATITVPGADEPIKGKVTMVSPALDPGSTTVEVWVQAANKEGAMKAGTSASISMTAQTVDKALVVPPDAIVTDEDGKKSVMVIGSDNVAHKRDVETGIQASDSIQLTKGVKPGEQVVTAGAYGLPDNTKVKVEAPPQPGKEGGDEKDKDKGDAVEK
ncbi:MAG: efflux RND transporter periplasmic adaptor subunit [Acidobacteria bacterium]|nr:efflux RND transporter periplasmic adaptor subunit [Acidobacteriota bacterium]MBV9144277.1 efflux RND transporter periplasmic adaptor subunit [Acidobacteriota bacterium]